jgi:hypothetical protein
LLPRIDACRFGSATRSAVRFPNENNKPSESRSSQPPLSMKRFGACAGADKSEPDKLALLLKKQEALRYQRGALPRIASAGPTSYRHLCTALPPPPRLKQNALACEQE